MIARSVGSTFLVLGLCACAAGPPRRAPSLRSHRPDTVAAPQVDEVRILQPFPTTTAQVGGAWIPWAMVDPNARGLGPTAPSADVEDGTGWAVRGGQYDDSLGLEFVFSTTEHDERNTGERLTTYAAYADLTDRWELWRGPVFAWVGVGFGFGLIRFDWSGVYKSQLTALWQGEGILALQIGRNVALEARTMAFFAAHPGRTGGTGVTTMLGGSIGF